jgi:proteasome lid subunit RPN8/RPN11
MQSPRIVAETRREVQEKAPPARDRTAVHHWATGEARERVKSVPGDEPYPLYLSRRAEERIRNHALSRREERLEVLGFLLGDVHTHSGATYTVVTDVATTDLDASSVAVRFDRGAFEKLFESMDAAGPDKLLVGWYHSHPGHGCFMSERDVETQTTQFPEPHHAAVVVDPIGFEWEAYAMRDGRVIPIPFVVFWAEYEDPYGGLRKVRSLRP